ncbi:MAG: hypothetical protein GX649_11520 [Chloroflexi bacterium]|nr:hypothetical protein [Chloroflexota bacterium]
MTERVKEWRRFRNEADISIADIQERVTDKEILATTAMYGPWQPDGTFDWASYDNLVREVVRSGSVPATNVDTTWAIYNDWGLTKEIIWRTAEVAGEESSYLAEDRPLVVAGVNTNPLDIPADEVAPRLRGMLAEIDRGLRERRLTDRIRYMPMPDRRLYDAPSDTKLRVYREIGQAIGEFTDLGMVFFELDIGIPGFGSNLNLEEIEGILSGTPQIQEYKSALISEKSPYRCQYDFADDILRINVVEAVAPERVQFSTGNDWFIALARYGKYIDRFGYLLGASQMSPQIFRRWREHVERGEICALAIEQDLQAAAKDFWTPGNVGIYRHYLAVFLAMTGLIEHPLPHPRCDERFRVLPADYFVPLRHAIRLGLVEREDAPGIVRRLVPGAEEMTMAEIERRIQYMG